MKKVKLLIALTAGIMIATSITSYAGSWEQDNRGWKYKDDNGHYSAGWVLDNGKYYYLGNDNYMLSDMVTPDGYYVNGNGEWADKSNTSDKKNITESWNVSDSVINSIIDEGIKLKEQAVASGKSVSIPQMINIISNHAEYSGGGTPVITLDKSGNTYILAIGTRLTSDLNQKGLYQILRLTGYHNVEELYDALYQSLEGNDSPINYNSFVDIAGHQIKAVNNGNSISYTIK